MNQKTVRLTMAQAVARFLTKQMTVVDGEKLPIFGGVFAIFGHGNVAGVGEALYGIKDTLPTYRAQNEQGMANAAIAFAKASFRRRFMACTTSIGPGALNMVTSAALAHVNRLPVLLLPGDVFANRRPDPVLQQIEDFGDGTMTVNDCFRPVSRYFDRITRPEQIIPALRRAMQVLTDPADCGPVTLSLCQDVQAEAYDYPESFFDEKVWTTRRLHPDADELAHAITALKAAKKPVIISGGGVLYSEASKTLAIIRRNGMAFRLSRPNPANPRCRTAIRSTWVRSASPAPRPPTSSPRTPMSFSRSARGCRISPPAPGRCSRTTT